MAKEILFPLVSIISAELNPNTTLKVKSKQESSNTKEEKVASDKLEDLLIPSAVFS